MKTIRAHDKAVVVVLSAREAKALYGRSQEHTGVKKSVALINAERKLLWAIDVDSPWRAGEATITTPGWRNVAS